MKKICLLFLCCLLIVTGLLAMQRITVVTSKITYEGAYLFLGQSYGEQTESLAYKVNLGTLITVELYNDIDIEEIKERYINQYDISNSELANEALKMHRLDVLTYYSKIRSEFKMRNTYLDYYKINENISSPFIFLQVDEYYNKFSIDALANKMADDEYVNSISIIDLYTTRKIESNSSFILGIAPNGIEPMSSPHNNPDFEFSSILNVINATESVLNTYDGTGVNVGIYEPTEYLSDYGIVDKEAPMLSGRNVISSKEDMVISYGVHAQAVASIAVGNYGVARNANVLTHDWDGTNYASTFLLSSVTESLQWFISEDRQANVINMSFGLLKDDFIDGIQYDKIAQYYDKFSYQNLVVLVASSGNEGSAQFVGTPANGYNVLTIGATNEYGNHVTSYSSYLEDSAIEKPNLVAPGNMMIPTSSQGDFYAEGTSLAAPLVTGAIALAMQKNQSLKFDPRKVISLVAATANKNVFSGVEYNDFTLGYENRIGAGLLDVKKLLDNVNNVKNFTFILSVNPISIIVHQQQIKAHTSHPVHIKIALFWYSQIYEQTRYTSKIKIEVYYNDIAKYTSIVHNNNTELVYINGLHSNGTLKIVVTRYEIVGSPYDSGSIAYWISPQPSGDSGGGGGFPPPEEVFRIPVIPNDEDQDISS